MAALKAAFRERGVVPGRTVYEEYVSPPPVSVSLTYSPGPGTAGERGGHASHTPHGPSPRPRGGSSDVEGVGNFRQPARNARGGNRRRSGSRDLPSAG